MIETNSCTDCGSPLLNGKRAKCTDKCKILKRIRATIARRDEKRVKCHAKKIRRMAVTATLDKVRLNSSHEAYNIVKWDVIAQIHAKDFVDDPCLRVVDEWMDSINYLKQEGDHHSIIRKSAAVDQQMLPQSN